jgi:hypothetical protein
MKIKIFLGIVIATIFCGCSSQPPVPESPIKDGLTMAWHWVDGPNAFEMHYTFSKTGNNEYTVSYVADSRYHGGHDRSAPTTWKVDGAFRREMLGEIETMVVQGCPIWIDSETLRTGKDNRWRISDEETILGRSAYKARDTLTPAIGWFDQKTGFLLASKLSDGGASVYSELIASNADDLTLP